MPRGKRALPELAVVLEGIDTPTLQIARDVLKMAGIKSWVFDQNISSIFRGPGGNPIIPVRLMVRVKDLPKARETLKKLKAT